MMGTVLYECTGELNRGVLIPFMMILGGILSYRADPKRFPRPAMIVFITISALVGGFILVDQVDQMVKLPKRQILPVPERNEQKLICGMSSLPDGGVMLALDCPALLET